MKPRLLRVCALGAAADWELCGEDESPSAGEKVEFFSGGFPLPELSFCCALDPMGVAVRVELLGSETAR